MTGTDPGEGGYFLKEIRSISRGGGGPGLPPPLSEKIQVYTFIVASEKKKHKGGGGGANQNPKNPGIDFYSGFRKTSQGGGGGGCKSNS